VFSHFRSGKLSEEKSEMTVAESHLPVNHSRVLIVSSDPVFRTQWIGDPQRDASEVDEAAGGAEALAKLESENWREVLVDRKLHDLDVSEVIRIIRLRHPHLVVRLVDSDQNVDGSPDRRATIEAAAESYPGAFASELDNSGDSFATVVREPLEDQDADLCRSRVEPLPGMAAAGSGLEQVFRLARLVGPRRTTVLITGETGTGKELVARGIHQISSRAKGPFVVVNCAAIPEQLLEAELFGHARGAFTGAVQSRIGRLHVAHGGTLFLDEVGELPLSMQAKLLRFLQDGEVQRLGSSDVFRVDVRVISATNVNLLRCVHEGRFRQDLYYRLAVFPVELPPLRERKEQIVPLAELFLDALCDQAGIPQKTLAASATAALRQYSWAGNVRELQHAVERAFILAGDSRQLRAAHFILLETAAPLREI
jgi:DNA-binding NtrC family response regulator